MKTSGETFDLEKRLTAWRRETAAALGDDQETLDELEAHLREDIARRRSRVMTEEEAFRLASAGLGETRAIALDIRKMQSTPWLPVRLFHGVSAIMSLLIISLIWYHWHQGSRSFLYGLHVQAITSGFVQIFLLGLAGFGCLLGRLFVEMEEELTQQLQRAASFYLQAVLAALAIGMLAAPPPGNRQGAFTFAVTLFLTGWTAIQWLVRRSGRVPLRLEALLAVAGAIIMFFAWFEPRALPSTAREYGASPWLWLNPALVAVAAAAVALAFLPAGFLRPKAPPAGAI